MNKYIIKNGLIGGLIVGLVLIGSTIRGLDHMDNSWSMIIGFSGMFAAFIFIFVGVNQYKNRENGGFITFGQALQIGLGIAGIASTMYVVVWLIELNTIYPNFMEEYAEVVLKKARTEGLSEKEMQEKIAEMASYKELYKNPIMVILFTYAEILPLGIVVALISAFVQKKSAKS